jgi:predicted GIY-YIG superfamily endonuclease
MSDTQTTPFVNTPEILYRLRAANGDLLYVGITRDFPSRLKQHYADKPWAYEIRSTEQVHIDGTRAQIEAIEKAVIIAEKPIYNKTHNVAPTMPAPVALTAEQLKVRDANAWLSNNGWAPLAFTNASGTAVNFSRYLQWPINTRAVARMAGHAVDSVGPDTPYKCARSHEHDCPATADMVARGYICPMPENVSFT